MAERRRERLMAADPITLIWALASVIALAQLDEASAIAEASQEHRIRQVNEARAELSSAHPPACLTSGNQPHRV
jgi:hypothetical protein